MTAEQQMLFPFTNKDEIYGWAKCYIDAQTGAERRVEQYLINLKTLYRHVAICSITNSTISTVGN